MSDIIASVALMAFVVVVAAAYALKAVARGPSEFGRVDAAGTSLLLRQGAMHAAYWVVAPLGGALARRGVSANTITFASLGLAAAAGAALALGHFGLGGLLAAFSTLGDALDGMVARESRTASDAGEVFDAAVDRYGEFLFLGGLALFFRGNVVILSLLLLAILGSFMGSYASAKAEAFSVEAPRGSMRRAERAFYLILGTALAPVVGLWSPAYARAPIVAAVFLVAVVANASAALRLDRIANLLMERDRAQTSAKRTTVGASPTDEHGDANGMGPVTR